MSKIVPAKDLGIPVPTTVDSTLHLIGYYGTAGFTPSYAQTQRADLGVVSGLKTTTVSGASYWDVPIASVLGSSAQNGSYGFAFTLMDANGNEGDFSPAVAETVDVTVPLALGQPIILS